MWVGQRRSAAALLALLVAAALALPGAAARDSKGRGAAKPHLVFVLVDECATCSCPQRARRFHDPALPGPAAPSSVPRSSCAPAHDPCPPAAPSSGRAPAVLPPAGAALPAPLQLRSGHDPSPR